jgi:hypothetical protein
MIPYALGAYTVLLHSLTSPGHHLRSRQSLPNEPLPFQPSFLAKHCAEFLHQHRSDQFWSWTQHRKQQRRLFLRIETVPQEMMHHVKQDSGCPQKTIGTVASVTHEIIVQLNDNDRQLR